MQAMLFITMCRCAGVPARWQSGWETKPVGSSQHDWAEFYVEPWGWLPYHFGGWVYYPGIGWVWIPDDFADFFGADVIWFEGPGWYGWCPGPIFVPPVTAGGGTGGGRIIRGPRGPRGCPAGAACGVIVSRGVVERGKPVNSGSIIGSDVFRGSPINPNSLPTNAPVRLPGSTLPSAPGSRGPKAPVVGRNPVGSPGIVYDPVTGRFVNDNNGTAPSTIAPEPANPRKGFGEGAEPVEPGENPRLGAREPGPPAWTRPSLRTTG